MSKEVKLNFYDEIIIITLHEKNYNMFKENIAKNYNIDPKDVDELTIYYFDNDKLKFFIKSEKEFEKMKEYSKKFSLEIHCEIHEESRLYKEKFEGNIVIKTENKNEFSLTAQKIQEEIQQKEKLLKETIERERQEIQLKKELAKKKAEMEQRKAKIAKLKLKKELLEREAELKKKTEKQDLETEVARLLNENIEKLKQQLIEQTVKKSMGIVEQQVEKRLQYSQCGTLHIGFTCSSCNISPISGSRFSCALTPDFHLCENCEYYVGDEHPYPLIKYRNQKQNIYKYTIADIESQITELKKMKSNDGHNFLTNTEIEESIILFENMTNKS